MKAWLVTRVGWTSLLGGAAAVLVAACVSDVDTVGGIGGVGGSAGAGTAPLAAVDKVDILLAIDNSRSMADKQQMLALAVADLVHALENPPCLDVAGHLLVQPAGPEQACPPDSNRPYAPILDIHIGVISSSLGG